MEPLKNKAVSASPSKPDKDVIGISPSRLTDETKRGIDIPEESDSTVMKVGKALKVLQSCHDFNSEDSFKAFETISIESVDESKREAIGDYLAGLDYAKVYVSVMKWVQRVEDSSGGCGPPDHFKVIAEMMGGFWNLSDGSPLLCRQLGKSGVLDIMFEDLKDTDVAIMAVNQLKKEKKRHHLFAKLGILHNCIRLVPDNRAIYRKAGAVRVLTQFVQAEKVAVYVKTICLLILAYIVDETESEKLASSSTGGCVNFLINLLQKALKSESQRYGGFTTFELLEGIHYLAMNDANKVIAVEGGCLALMKRMMEEGHEEKDQLLAVRGVWRLAFSLENKKIIREDEALLNALEQLHKSQNQSVRSASAGALWEIYEGKINLSNAAPSKRPFATPATKGNRQGASDQPHVMISYQWDVQNRMIVLKNLLNDNGYKVWMDIEKMEGNILVAMANAIEKAAVVLVCVSQKYKESESCRTEASYAYKKRKPIVPVMMEEGYDPDGWLGALVGVKLYFNMYSQDQVRQQLANLIQELGSRGQGENAASSQDTVDGHAPAIPDSTSTSNRAPSPAQTSTHSCEAWTKDQVQSWLVDIGMSDLAKHLNYCDGTHLVQMYRQCKTCPEYFHSALRTDLKMDFHAVLRFTTALEQLFR